jgi:hypothetical protein
MLESWGADPFDVLAVRPYELVALAIGNRKSLAFLPAGAMQVGTLQISEDKTCRAQVTANNYAACGHPQDAVVLGTTCALEKPIFRDTAGGHHQ